MLGDGITIEEFERLPQVLAQDHELIDGKLVDVSERTGYHNVLRDHLLVLLYDHVHERRLGLIITEQDFDFDGNAHGPDLSLVGPAKLGLLNRDLRVQRLVPDLAVEIVAANDLFIDVLRKIRRYRRCGTQEVWLLCPATCEAFVFSEDRQTILSEDQRFESKLIPGISIPLRDLFVLD